MGTVYRVEAGGQRQIGSCIPIPNRLPLPSGFDSIILYREVFGTSQGNGPKPMTEEEAAVPIKLGNTVTTRGTARQASLNVLTLLASRAVPQ